MQCVVMTTAVFLRLTTDPAPLHTPSLTQAHISPREIIEINDSHSMAVASHYPDGSSCNAKQMCCQISPESYGCLSAETAVCPDDYSHFPQVTVPTPLHILSLTQAPISPRGIVGINYSNSSKLQSVVLSNIRYTIPSVTLT
ncbi:uncharacterized protein [Periplaneta americana]|uniref:uncharacterized protein isoform X2 n=1 Tax=Periplaneta americana TaxID=6978 RepID=UPI0037E7056E